MNHCDQKAPKECLESRKHLLSSLKLLANELDKGASTMLEVLWTGCASSQGRHLVVIDTDPGIDDFLAILLALGDPTISLEAITCVRGNTPLPQVVVNLYRVLDLARRLEIPVYKGSDHGLVYTPPSDNFFGKDGFGGLSNNLSYYQCLASKVQKEHAASFLARIVREKPGQVTILAVAPLTNLALALHLNPNFLKQARKVIILGGTVRGSGNVRPGIEFNFYADPDAAAVVLDRAESCGTPVTLVPMETVVECDLGGEWRWNELTKTRNNVTLFLEKLERRGIEMHPQATLTYAPYDAYTVVALVNPSSVLSTQKVYGKVETSGDITRGALVVDYLNTLRKNPNIEVITAMNPDEMRKTITQNLATFGKTVIL